MDIPEDPTRAAGSGNAGCDTFTVRIKGGTARVVCNNLYKVYVEATFEDGRVKKWIRQTMTAAELLVRLGAEKGGNDEKS